MAEQGTLFNYCLRLGDQSLIHAQRLAEWTGHGPFLEEDLALTNISLDMLGRANALLNYAGRIEGKKRTEDDLAFRRSEREFYNSLLVEQASGDYARTMVRLWLATVFDLHLYNELTKSSDETISGIALKSVKEITYHVRHSAAWLERFAGGTEESRVKTQSALNDLWRFTGDMFDESQGDKELAKNGVGADMKKVKDAWDRDTSLLLNKTDLRIPENVFMQYGSRLGKHSENLGFILAEMQYLPRAYPEAKW